MENTKFPCAVLAIACCIGLGAPTTFAAPGDIYPIPSLTVGDESWGRAINNSGQVTGDAHPLVPGPSQAFRFSPGGPMENIPGIRGDGINDIGQIVGSIRVANAEHAFRYTGAPGMPGVVEDLGTLGGGRRSYANGVNNSGQVVGVSETITTPHDYLYRTFRYTGEPGTIGIMEDLGVFRGTAISDSGQVGGSGWHGGLSVALRYTGEPGSVGVMEVLGSLDPAPVDGEMNVTAINNTGQVVGYLLSGTDETGENPKYQAFVYTGAPGAGGEFRELRPVADFNFDKAVVNDINESGMAVGTSWRYWGGIASLWMNDAERSVIDLNAWLDAVNPAVGAKWGLSSAQAINDNGLIVGAGWYSEIAGGPQVQRSFILDASTLVPEPSALAIALAVSTAVLRRSRK